MNFALLCDCNHIVNILRHLSSFIFVIHLLSPFFTFPSNIDSIIFQSKPKDLIARELIWTREIENCVPFSTSILRTPVNSWIGELNNANNTVDSLDSFSIFCPPVCTQLQTRGQCTCTSFERRLAPACTRVIAVLCEFCGNVPATCRRSPIFRILSYRRTFVECRHSPPRNAAFNVNPDRISTTAFDRTIFPCSL